MLLARYARCAAKIPNRDVNEYCIFNDQTQVYLFSVVKNYASFMEIKNLLIKPSMPIRIIISKLKIQEPVLPDFKKRSYLYASFYRI